MTIQEALKWGSSQLSESTSPEVDSRYLLQFVLDCSYSQILTWPDKALNQAQYIKFEQVIQQRKAGTPVAYIIGFQGFWGMEFKVTEDTLIPRADTEVLVETVLNIYQEQIPHGDCLNCVDLGTGTGAIAIALKSECPNWKISAVDFSQKALEVAKSNAEQLQQDVAFKLGSWLDGVAPASLDLIVSNPPYIEADDVHLTQGDLRFEPASALASGKDGLDDIREIVSQATTVLKPNGMIFFEHGYNQAASVRAILASSDFIDIESVQDYGGNDRVTYGRFNHCQ